MLISQFRMDILRVEPVIHHKVVWILIVHWHTDFYLHGKETRVIVRERRMLQLLAC